MLCSERCRTCRWGSLTYAWRHGERLYVCSYYLRKYTRRPCPAGDGCTVYEQGQGRKEWYIEPMYFGRETDDLSGVDV